MRRSKNPSHLRLTGATTAVAVVATGVAVLATPAEQRSVRATRPDTEVAAASLGPVEPAPPPADAKLRTVIAPPPAPAPSPSPSPSPTATPTSSAQDVQAASANDPEPAVQRTWTGVASWYGDRFAGQETASGEPFDPNALTAAHRTLPLGSRVRVTDLRTGESVVVRINDRGPYVDGREIDLSRAAAQRIGITDTGTGDVRLELLG